MTVANQSSVLPTRGHRFENVAVDGQGTALLGDLHVHNDAGPNPDERDQIARRGKSHRFCFAGRSMLILLELAIALAYDSMSTRRMQLAQDPAQHVEWIWDNKTRYGPGFVEWLANSTPIFWITGKPGSGKSTLMKHIVDSTRTKNLLWRSSDRQWLVVHFYFDFRGGAGIANSIDGLLRSILSQLTRDSSAAADAIRHDVKGADNDLVHSHLDQQELLHLLHVATRAISEHYSICAFVDGLDEFHGQYLVLVRFVKHLGEHGITKVCVASRPEPMLAQYLESLPSFKMQDYNAETIHSFMEDTLQEFSAQSHHELDLNKLATDILEASQGVILWAQLVVIPVVQSVLAGETREEVYAALDEFPEELNDVYQRLFQSLAPMKQLESAIFLHLIHTSVEGTSLRDLQCAIVFLRDVGWLSCWPKQPLSPEDFVKRLKSRTGSLVDIVDHSERDPSNLMVRVSTSDAPMPTPTGNEARYPQLFHRTLKTYLATYGWAEHILTEATPSIEPENLWLRICLDCLRQTEVSGSTLSKMFEAYDEKATRKKIGLVEDFELIMSTMSAYEELRPLVRHANHVIADGRDFVEYAVSMVHHYRPKKALWKCTESLQDLFLDVMGTNTMLLHNWMSRCRETIQLAFQNDLLSWCDCDSINSRFDHRPWTKLVSLTTTQRAAMFALEHWMYEEFADWVSLGTGCIDKDFTKIAIFVLSHIPWYRADNETLRKTWSVGFRKLLAMMSKLAPFVDDSDLGKMVCSSHAKYTNQILEAIFVACPRSDHGLRWINTNSLTEHSAPSGWNLLGMWSLVGEFPEILTSGHALCMKKIGILLDSGLDVNGLCSEHGPALHTAIASTDSRIQKIECLIQCGADVTQVGPSGTPIEMVRSQLRSHAEKEPQEIDGLKHWNWEKHNKELVEVARLLEEKPGHIGTQVAVE